MDEHAKRIQDAADAVAAAQAAVERAQLRLYRCEVALWKARRIPKGPQSQKRRADQKQLAKAEPERSSSE